MKKPIQRSKGRLFLGKIYFSLKKHYYWSFSKIRFAEKIKSPLKYQIFSHKTLLHRKLKNVDLWMQENKIKNLNIAIQNLDGLIIEPGETFSYWRQIGNPTQRKGYVEGMILSSGRVIAGIGGGLCQLSNLIYWMTLNTPLSVVERWRHSYDVFPDANRSQPFGSGATCSYPNIDLQIQNNTQEKFQLSLKLTDQFLVGSWLSNKPTPFEYEIFEKEHEIKSEFWGGYSRNNKIFRKMKNKNTGEIINEEFITENHAIMMYNPFLKEGA